MSRPLAVGIDLGGTQLRAALVDRTGAIVSRAATATDVDGGPNAVVAQMLHLSDQLGMAARRGDIAGVGVSAPGPLDSDTGTILGIPTLPGWEDVPLAALLAAAFDLPVTVENDGIAAANGEWRFGSARGLRNVVYVTVSTGIGGGVVVDDHLLHGRRGMAGHIGHMIVDPFGPLCSCGARGCFEALASGTALGRAGRQAVEQAPQSLLATTAAGRPISGRDVVDAARAGDRVALDLLDREAAYLGLGFSNLAHLFSPDAIIMGGGVSQGFDLLSGKIVETLHATAMPPFRETQVLPAMLGDNAGLVGAAARFWGSENMAV